MEAKRAVAGLSALAHDSRLAAFRLLVQRGPDGLSAGIIAESLGVAPSALTFHLQQLTHAGLITQRRVGRQLIYAINVQAMNGLMAYLTENCCGGAVSCSPVCRPETMGAENPSDQRTA